MQLENNVSLFLIHSFPNSQVCDSVPHAGTQIHHVCAVEVMAEMQAQGWGLLVI